MTMAKHMKGITCCADCTHYNLKKHRCNRGFDIENDPRDHFYDNCDLPDVQPVVHGKWIPVTSGNWGSMCNLCQRPAPTYKNGTEYASRYCPNCGARMDLEDDT